MAFSLEEMLAGKVDEVLVAIWLQGVDGAMKAYGITARKAFMAWTRSHTSISLYPNKLTEMSGGEKAKWLRDHRETVLDCLENFGRDFTMTNFHLRENTLHDFIHSDSKPFVQKLNRVDRLELIVSSAVQTAEEALHKGNVQDCRIDVIAEGECANSREINELKEQFAAFQDGVCARMNKMMDEVFTKPFVQRLVSSNAVKDLPERTDPLSIDGFISSSKAALKGLPDELPPKRRARKDKSPQLAVIVKVKRKRSNGEKPPGEDSENPLLDTATRVRETKLTEV